MLGGNWEINASFNKDKLAFMLLSLQLYKGNRKHHLVD